MTVSTLNPLSKLPQNRPKIQHDILALKIFDSANPRTWEVIESKGQEGPILDLGTWEDVEKKQVVANVRKRRFHGDKLPHHRA